jgi:hypothetical protein
MENKTTVEFNNDIERGNNLPVVASRYGFREEFIDGKKYLVAMTKDEYVDAVKNTTDIPKEHLDDLIQRIENDKASCYMYTTFACATRDNCQTCNIGVVQNRWYCYCCNWPC